MYSKSALENKTRRLVFNYISANAGVTFGTIRRVLDLEDSTLRYHLKYLEREDEIISKSEGRFRCYYANQVIGSTFEPVVKHDVAMLSRPQQRISTIIRRNPGITIRELMKITRLNKRDLQYHLKKLRELMIIWKVGYGRNTGYEYISKKKLRTELYRQLILKFIRNEIDEETYLFLREELEKENY
jgi:predicted transcriptional regulator